MSDVSEKVLRKRLENERAKDMVKELCERFPSARGDYRLLYWRYLREKRGCSMRFREFESLFEGLRGGYSPETIGRRYRELVQEAKNKLKEAVWLKDENAKRIALEDLKVLLPSEETQNKRKTNCRVFKSHYSQGFNHILPEFFEANAM